LSVVLPVFGNEESLDELFARLDEVGVELLDRHDVTLQLVAVDDGSKDGSLRRLLELKRDRANLKVVKLTRNFGAVHASRTGLKFVEGDCFVIMAADLQEPPELLLDMVELWRQGTKFVIAERRSRDDPLFSKAFSWLYYRLIRALVVPGYPRRGFDMALMDRSLLPHMRNAAKHAFTPLLAYWLGAEPATLKYDRPRRKHGRSGWSMKRKVRAFFDVLFGFSATPIRFISLIGAVVATGSVIYGVLVVLAAVRGEIPVDGFATVASLVTFLLGLILVMLGVIGEYLWRISDEVNRRPEAVIEEVF
jgi:dolichol-phosphate mannosyltransferase